MPELPEIETIKRQLSKKLQGKKITDIEIRFQKILKGITAKNFKKVVKEAKIKNIGRRAKLVLITLSTSNTLIIHLKLTGRLLFVSKKTEPTKHTRIIFYLSSGGKLFFEDIRKFGFIKAVPTEDLELFFQKERFGPEPLEKGFSLKIFKELLIKKSRSKIKPLLMEQKFIAGVGNIYSSEACFCAGILPTRIAGSLKDEEIKKLYNCLRKILRAAIKTKGSSVDAYRDVSGQKGKYEPFLKVYGRGGEKCLKCGNIIKTTRLGGRGTAYCGKCQH